MRTERDRVGVEVALWWNDSYHESVLCFTNNIPQRDGGHPLGGLPRRPDARDQQVRTDSGISKKEKVDLSGEDAREGLSCVLSVKVPDPKFSSQTKDKLVSSEVKPVVESIVADQLTAWFEEHPKVAKTIVNKIVEAALAREAAARLANSPAARVRSTPAVFPAASPNARIAIPPTPNSSSSRATRQAAPPSRAASASNQAVHPIRGKILNVERARIDKMLSSEQVTNIIGALGTGIRDDFDISKLRYHKIIIMTDADVDGAHIRTLLLTFFYRQMHELGRRAMSTSPSRRSNKVSRARAAPT